MSTRKGTCVRCHRTIQMYARKMCHACNRALGYLTYERAWAGYAEAGAARAALQPLDALVRRRHQRGEQHDHG